MKYIRQLFSEKSDVSMMRVLSLISLLVGSYLAISGKDESVMIFVSSAFGGKALQKLIEMKNPTPASSESESD